MAKKPGEGPYSRSDSLKLNRQPEFSEKTRDVSKYVDEASDTNGGYAGGLPKGGKDNGR